LAAVPLSDLANIETHLMESLNKSSSNPAAAPPRASVVQVAARRYLYLGAFPGFASPAPAFAPRQTINRICRQFNP
jgi:hypothetical protein